MRTSNWLAAAVAFCLATVAPVIAQPMYVTPGAQVPAKPPIRLAKMVMRINRGATIGEVKGGMLCMPRGDLYMDRGTTELSPAAFDDLFRQGMSAAGYRLAGNPSNLFEDQSDAAAAFFVGGLITRIDADLCFPNKSNDSKGSARIDVEWQIYSALERKVVGVLRTTGVADEAEGENDPWDIVFQAFANSVQQLADNQRMKAAMVATPIDASAAQKAPANLAPLAIATTPIAPATVAEAVGSTVLVFANGGEGSGFLISPEGYVLTNYHVVGTSQYVKIKWSDGTEALGEVVRSHKARDVALIKTDARGRKPLRLRSLPVTISEDIYAIGAPMGKAYQNSVTKGIVSATRVSRGFNYIQSDVGVTHGNSGGPIVDSKGQVVGMTVSGREDATMLNFFIPIQEAQDFLGLKLAPPK